MSKATTWGAILLTALSLAAGFAAYAVPLGAGPEGFQRVEVASFHQVYRLSGNATQDEQVQTLSTVLPGNFSFEHRRVQLGLRFRMSNTGPMFQGNALRADVNLTVDGRQVFVRSDRYSLGGGDGLSATAIPPEGEISCPCQGKVVEWRIEFHVSNPRAANYSYTYEPKYAVVLVSPVDRNQDGLPDHLQWIPGVPQYVTGLAIAGTVFLAGRRWVRPRGRVP